jgi:hypothetical protein
MNLLLPRQVDQVDGYRQAAPAPPPAAAPAPPAAGAGSPLLVAAVLSALVLLCIGGYFCWRAQVK